MNRGCRVEKTILAIPMLPDQVTLPEFIPGKIIGSNITAPKQCPDIFCVGYGRTEGIKTFLKMRVLLPVFQAANFFFPKDGAVFHSQVEQKQPAIRALAGRENIRVENDRS